MHRIEANSGLDTAILSWPMMRIFGRNRGDNWNWICRSGFKETYET